MNWLMDNKMDETMREKGGKGGGQEEKGGEGEEWKEWKGRKEEKDKFITYIFTRIFVLLQYDDDGV